MVTTHDLPTVAGVWTGADEAELVALHRPTPEAERHTLRRRLDALVGLDPATPVGTVVDAVHHHLAESPATLVLGTLEDACEVPLRPNVPGTTARALQLVPRASPHGRGDHHRPARSPRT